MADFCRQCSMDHFFGNDTRDLAGITTKEDMEQGLYALVICEGCGFVQVDPDGNCISRDCAKYHGKCPTCGSKGFPPSSLGFDRCTFCDGTEGGQGPKD